MLKKRKRAIEKVQKPLRRIEKGSETLQSWAFPLFYHSGISNSGYQSLRIICGLTNGAECFVLEITGIFFFKYPLQNYWIENWFDWKKVNFIKNSGERVSVSFFLIAYNLYWTICLYITTKVFQLQNKLFSTYLSLGFP